MSLTVTVDLGERSYPIVIGRGLLGGNFVEILPGGSPLAAYLHLCRTVSRRAERQSVELATMEAVNPAAVKCPNGPMRGDRLVARTQVQVLIQALTWVDQCVLRSR